MLFNSFTFFVFLAVVMIVSRLCRSWKLRKFFLLLMSYVFYAYWNPPFVILLWISTVADWFLAKWIHRTPSKRLKLVGLLGSLGVNLGLLGFFKYSGFLLRNAQALADLVGFTIPAGQFSVILPVGISFYTFQTLSYTLDVYRGDAKPWHSWLDYALYVTFFPQLVAGPIVRATDFLPQCIKPKKATGKQLGWGLVLLIVGLFNKVVVADNFMAPIVEKVYDPAAINGLLTAWLGTLAFAVQIFSDFAGYSTCAIGVALMLGFELPDNFRFPYAAIGFSDFWRRWHISLSTWLRDYLYISLGGNRKSKWKTYRNLLLTMLLGGLWHGASWNFVAWGGMHGLYLVIERLLRKAVPDKPIWHKRPVKLAVMALTFIAVCFAWVFFRAKGFSTAGNICIAMLGLNGNMSGLDTTILDMHRAVFTALVIGACLCTHILMRKRSLESLARKIPWPLSATVLGIMACCITLGLLKGKDSAFIYFQF